MKRNFRPSLLLFICIGSFSGAVGQSPAVAAHKIVIIRHGEKPEAGDNLSCQGLNRALQLPAVLHKKFGAPAFVYVPSINTGKTTSTARMYQTVLPLAIKYNLAVNSKYRVDDVQGLAQSLLKKDGTVLVVWEHKNINNIAAALGVKEKVKWEGSDFDSIWIVTIANGSATLTKDAEGLTPAAACQ